MTNTVSYPSATNTWVNADGLPVRFGKGNQVDAVAGYATHYGDDIVVTYSLLGDRLPVHGASAAIGQIYGGYPNLAIPAGAFLKSFITTVSTAFTTTSSPTITLGLVDKAGADMSMNSGIHSATASSTFSAGAVVTADGATIATVLAATAPAYYLWASVGTADITAGVGRSELTYFMPDTDKNNT